MWKHDVIQYFGGNQSEAGRFLGLSRQTVSSWGEVIPELQARRYAEKTRGRARNGVVLKFDAGLYEQARKAS